MATNPTTPVALTPEAFVHRWVDAVHFIPAMTRDLNAMLAAETERCARVCFDHGETCDNPSVAYVHGCQTCAELVRPGFMRECREPAPEVE